MDWQHHLREAIRDLPALLDYLQLTPEACAISEAAAQQFPVRVPRPFLARMKKGDPNDPLLLQVLARPEEMLNAPGFTPDPLAEAKSNPAPGVIHKYQGRVLLMPTGACAVHCRYCFRRHFPYEENRLDPQALDQSLAYLAARPDISEVILSGGDPLVMTDDRLSDLMGALEQIPHLRRLRIHTRLPVVIPQRMTAALADRLRQSRLDAVVVLHCNHPAEVDDVLRAHLLTWRSTGLTLLNQAVLLRDVNDSADCLAALSETLFAAGVLPYYLHVLDPVTGAAHFDVPDAEARELHDALRNRLPGYLVPRLVREVPQKASKTLLS